jgi:threonine/homoserine/homoserine lactone efflux protein
MTPLFIAFLAAAALLTVTPGLDTAFVLRAAAADGARRAALGAAGILLGCLLWAGAVAVGLGALLAASETAYRILKWIGALYLGWLGLQLMLRRRTFEIGAASAGEGVFWRGLLTNLLNPKIGVFYVSFLPQFVPDGAPAPAYLMLLALIHAAMGALWFLLLILLTTPIARFLRRPLVIRAIDRATGGLFIGFAALLAFDERP